MINPEELIAWLDENDILMGGEVEDAEVEEYSIDNLMDIVCEWNYIIFSEVYRRYCLSIVVILREAG